MSKAHEFFDFSDFNEPSITGVVDDKEELRPVIWRGKTYLGYSVSNLGNVYTHKVAAGIIDRRSAKRLKPYTFIGTTNSRGSKATVCIVDIKKGHIAVHKLVMNAFRPVDEYPPAPITVEEFRACPESVKQWIRDTVVINHIDHDVTNNRVENLEYTTPRGNVTKAVQHHGGTLSRGRNYSSPTQQAP